MGKAKVEEGEAAGALELPGGREAAGLAAAMGLGLGLAVTVGVGVGVGVGMTFSQ